MTEKKKVEDSPMHIAGKHALVTGAGKRIGRALAEALLKRGASLTAHYHHSKKEVDSLIEDSKKRGLKCQAIQADLADPAGIEAAVEKAVKTFGPVDILINSASRFYPTPTAQVTKDQWDDLLNVNLRGQFFFAKAAAKSMAARHGVIVNIADVHGEKPIKNHTPYAVSKAGLLMLSRNLAKELAPHVRVNSVSPGPILPPESYTDAQKARSIELTLLKRWGEPKDIVEAVLFLIGNDYITGFNLKVDGGRSLV